MLNAVPVFLTEHLSYQVLDTTSYIYMLLQVILLYMKEKANTERRNWVDLQVRIFAKNKESSEDKITST